MANFTFDVSQGRAVELYNRVNDSDPTNAAFILVVLANAGLETDAALRVYTNLSALLAGASNEVGNGGYARKTLTDADIDAYTVDTATHTITLELANQTFTTIAAGDSWRKALLCYDNDTTGGTDANLIPVFAWDLLINGVAVVPNGSNIILSFPNGMAVAS
jgi:hypothetical protein